MLELAETVLEITNSKSKIIFQPLPSDDPKQRNPNIERARKELDWEPQIDLQSGLTRTVEYFQGII